MEAKQPDQAQAMVPVTAASDLEYDRFARLGTWLAATEGSSDPRGKDGMVAALRFALAAELGWPLRAASEIAVIHGRLHISSKMLRALAEREGYRVVRVEETATSCTAAVLDRAGEEVGRATFTLEDAKRAGLVKDKSAWQTYPARMLWARAAGWAINDAIPHVALGLAMTEEAEDYIEGEARELPDEPEAKDEQREPEQVPA
ncbi:MAG TPA: hypothetical protein VH834_18140 [Solirubrobacteraceae bacterium]